LTCFEKQLICQDAFNFMPAESLDQNMHCRCQQPSLETIGSDVVETLGVSKPNIYSNGNPIQQFLGLAQDSGWSIPGISCDVPAFGIGQVAPWCTWLRCAPWSRIVLSACTGACLQTSKTLISTSVARRPQKPHGWLGDDTAVICRWWMISSPGITRYHEDPHWPRGFPWGFLATAHICLSHGGP
jgi:hypothetical protein